MTTLTVENLGQIRKADIEFGDLTVLVGPQATGKSITLQLLRLLVDMPYVYEELTRHGLDWQKRLDQFFDLYFGEGMRAIWKAGESSVTWDGALVDMALKISRKTRAKTDERLFFIPAQRVLAMSNGWPRPFTDYAPGDPFAVREFSERLRQLVEKEFSSETLFPQPRRLKAAFRTLLDRDVFSSFQLGIDRHRSQKRLVLKPATGSDPLPFMVWSAGQREFVPLLLGLYWLMPPTRTDRRAEIEWVVIEEPEMGLHPKAVSIVTLLVFELMHRGYRVCLSTHSTQVLECIWAVNRLKEHKAEPRRLLEVFEAPKTRPLIDVAARVLHSDIKVYYFDREWHVARDISSLDMDTASVAGWGGLAEFSGRVNEAVARVVANSRVTAS